MTYALTHEEKEDHCWAPQKMKKTKIIVGMYFHYVKLFCIIKMKIRKSWKIHKNNSI